MAAPVVIYGGDGDDTIDNFGRITAGATANDRLAIHHLIKRAEGPYDQVVIGIDPT